MRRHRLTIPDLTDPEHWPEQQIRGRAAFQLRYGIPVGVLLAVVYDVVLLAVRHDLPLFFAARHAAQLVLITLCVAPVGGLIAARMLWRRGERRYGDALLTREFLGELGNGQSRSERSGESTF
jgi:hypothetical protein